MVLDFLSDRYDVKGSTKTRLFISNENKYLNFPDLTIKDNVVNMESKQISQFTKFVYSYLGKSFFRKISRIEAFLDNSDYDQVSDIKTIINQLKHYSNFLPIISVQSYSLLDQVELLRKKDLAPLYDEILEAEQRKPMKSKKSSKRTKRSTQSSASAASTSEDSSSRSNPSGSKLIGLLIDLIEEKYTSDKVIKKHLSDLQSIPLEGVFDFASGKRNYANAVLIVSDDAESKDLRDNVYVYLTKEGNGMHVPLTAARGGDQQSIIQNIDHVFNTGYTCNGWFTIIHVHSEKMILQRMKYNKEKIICDVRKSLRGKKDPIVTFALYTELKPCITCQKDIAKALYDLHQGLTQKFPLNISISHENKPYDDLLLNLYNKFLERSGKLESLEGILEDIGLRNQCILLDEGAPKRFVLYQLLEGGLLRLGDDTHRSGDGVEDYITEDYNRVNYEMLLDSVNSWIRDFSGARDKVRSIINSQFRLKCELLSFNGKDLSTDPPSGYERIDTICARSGFGSEIESPTKNPNTKVVASKSTPLSKLPKEKMGESTARSVRRISFSQLPSDDPTINPGLSPAATSAVNEIEGGAQDRVFSL